MGLTWLDGDPSALTNLKLQRRNRLELGGRIEADPSDGNLSGAIVGLRHQIHRYLAWGISATVRDRSGAGGSDSGGSFVFMARKRRWLGTLLGIKGKLAAGVGDAISIDGFGLRANMEVDWDAPGGVTLMAGAKVRSITEDFGGHTGLDGWLAAESSAARSTIVRMSLGYGICGPPCGGHRSGATGAALPIRHAAPPGLRPAADVGSRNKSSTSTSRLGCLRQ